MEQAVQDMDWWVDQAIIELSYLEKTNLDRHLEENQVEGSDGIIRFKRVYRDIARYRRDHSRIHKVPLDSNQMTLINDFVEKYK